MKENKLIVQQNIFRHWLVENIVKFRFKPMFIRTINTLNSVDIYRFEGLCNELELLVSNHSLDIAVLNAEGDVFDFLFALEINIEKSRDGLFICTLCKTPEKYVSLMELYVVHSFQKLLNWINKLNEKDNLYFYGIKNNGDITSRWAEITVLPNTKAVEHIICRIPVLSP